MAEQTQQQESIGLSQQYNIGALIGSLMDLQQLVRTVPNIIASAEALKTERDDLKAKLAATEDVLKRAEERLAALAPKVVEKVEESA